MQFARIASKTFKVMDGTGGLHFQHVVLVVAAVAAFSLVAAAP